MSTRTTAVFLLAVGVAVGGASWAAQGPLPGDLALTRLAQGFFGGTPVWAQNLTASAGDGWMWAVMIGCALIVLALRGGRAASGIALSFAVALAADKLLRLYLYVPRPAADLVMVAKPSGSSGLPSTFGLIYGATVGVAMLAALHRRDATGRIFAFLFTALLIAGGLARVTMGGHWASQVIASYALAMGMGLAVLRYGQAD